MRALLRFADLVDAVSERLGNIATLLVIVAIIVGFYNVVVRYLGQFIGVQLASNLWIETQWYIYSLIFFLAFPYILKHGDNVRVDFLYTNWSLRRRAWVDLLGTVLFLIPFCIIGIAVTISPVLSSWRIMEWSPDPGGLPRAPIKTMIIVAFAMLLIQAITQVIKYLAVLTGHSEVEAEVLDAESSELTL
ncbi:MAG: TRAP transporter small permease subunit [Caldilineaceae bacterium]